MHLFIFICFSDAKYEECLLFKGTILLFLSSMITIFIRRHAETEHNQNNVLPQNPCKLLLLFFYSWRVTVYL